MFIVTPGLQVIDHRVIFFHQHQPRQLPVDLCCRIGRKILLGELVLLFRPIVPVPAQCSVQDARIGHRVDQNHAGAVAFCQGFSKQGTGAGTDKRQLLACSIGQFLSCNRGQLCHPLVEVVNAVGRGNDSGHTFKVAPELISRVVVAGRVEAVQIDNHGLKTKAYPDSSWLFGY